jgi:uncharacterized SAM-binding protein YcdF (DUF218 family)
MLLSPVRLAVKALIVLLVLGVAVLAYFAVTLMQVWLTSRHHDPRPAAAVIVMGAAQYNGVPSPDLRARLDEAAALYRGHYVQLIVVTGSKEKGDRFTEAESGARYLESVGVPASRILEAGGSDSYQNIAGAAALLVPRGDRTILIATDPFHEDRSMAIASGAGLVPYPTPTESSPIRGWSSVPYFLKEALAVGVGRVIGYGRLSSWVK